MHKQNENRYAFMELEAHETLNKRFGRFVALLSVVGMITGVVVVTQRLSQDSLALLVGLSCGVAAMLPTIGLALLVWRREETRQHMNQQQPPMASPPVVVITPQGLASGSGLGYGMSPALTASAPQPVSWQWQPSANERVFTIVGGEE